MDNKIVHSLNKMEKSNQKSYCEHLHFSTELSKIPAELIKNQNQFSHEMSSLDEF